MLLALLLYCGCTRKSASKSTDTIENLMHYYPSLAENKLDSLTSISAIHCQLDVDYIKSFLLYRKGNIDSSLVAVEACLKGYVINNNMEGQAKCKLLLGWISESIGQYEQAKINFYSSLNTSPKKSIQTVHSIHGIARCKFYLNESIDDELKQVDKILIDINNKEYNLYSKFLSTILNNNFQEKDIQDLLSLSIEFQELGLESNAANIIKSVALKYSDYNKLDSAIISINKGIALNTSNPYGFSILPALYQIKGSVYYKKNELDSASHYLNKALQLYDAHSLHDRKYYSYTLLRKIAFDKKEYIKAYDLLDKALQSEKKSKSITKARIAKLIEISSGINILSTNLEKLKFQQKTTVLLVFIGLLGTAFAFYIVTKNNREKTRKANNKNKELHSLVIALNEKVLLQKRYGRTFDATNQSSKTLTLAEKFDKCYNETLKSMSDEYSSLSNTECRYALLFGMDFGDDAICSIQSVQKATVRKARQRIRTKLSLAADINLNVFFNKSLVKGNKDEFIKNDLLDNKQYQKASK